MKMFCIEHDEREVLDSTAEIALTDLDEESSLTLSDIREATLNDADLKLLTSTIQTGFSETHHSTDPAIRQYFNVRDDLWLQEDIVMFRNRIVIPKRLRSQILRLLHSAHQGIDGMRARASDTVYWPGLTSAIKQIRANCMFCNKIAPSQARETLRLIPSPEFPFQHVCVDAFDMHGHQYMVAVDRYSGWLVVFHYRQHPHSKHIIKSLRSLFSVYGAPEKLFSDGGLTFQSQDFKEFLRIWKIDHETSSASYPQANGRAELAVKTAKRTTLSENVSSDGSLDTDRTCRALLQYRNTPIKHLGLSPAQILFHRNLRDGLPTDPRRFKPHKRWITAAHHREEAFQKRNVSLVNRYNRTTRKLSSLPVGTTVLIQDPSNRRRWNRSGWVVHRNNRKYFIRLKGSGRIATRNRRFIKPVEFDAGSEVGAELLCPHSSNNEDAVLDQHTPADTTHVVSSNEDGVNVTDNNARPGVSNGNSVARALKRIAPHNKPGLKEL